LTGSRGGSGKAAALAATTTATQRVYDGVYLAIVEHRLRPGARLREEELADTYGVSRTLVRQALQRLAADQVVELQHNRGAQVPQPGLADAAHVFDARRVVECDVARRLSGQVSGPALLALEAIVDAEAAAHDRGDRAAAIRLSAEFHRELARLSGNPVFVRLIDELLPTTSLLIALYQRGDRPGCLTHNHQRMIAALQAGTPARAAAEMRRHLDELEKSLADSGAALRRDVFALYRDPAGVDKV
jgi:DNA-binding GntR family transcriptional regulator